uniref:Uncharacterized protein n=1 Tax=Arundo donax TaxID=35708 RepID=A0A0A8Z1D9_ARUDO
MWLSRDRRRSRGAR